MRLLNLYVVGFWLLNEDKMKNRFIMVDGYFKLFSC